MGMHAVRGDAAVCVGGEVSPTWDAARPSDAAIPPPEDTLRDVTDRAQLTRLSNDPSLQTLVAHVLDEQHDRAARRDRFPHVRACFEKPRALAAFIDRRERRQIVRAW